MNDPDPHNDPLASFALKLADAAGEIARKWFRHSPRMDRKADNTVVTLADREIEEKLRQMIAAERPGDGIIGEEFGRIESSNGLEWVIDPIDGTKAFATGRATFSTLIALAKDGRPFMSVIDQPVIGDRWLGRKGFPVLFGGRPARVSACTDIADARLHATSPFMFEGADFERFQKLSAQCRLTIFQGDSYAYGLLASGFLDIDVQASLSVYDFLAAAPVVESAGGVITDWQGNPLNTNSDGRVLAAASRDLHSRALDILGAAS